MWSTVKTGEVHEPHRIAGKPKEKKNTQLCSYAFSVESGRVQQSVCYQHVDCEHVGDAWCYGVKQHEGTDDPDLRPPEQPIRCKRCWVCFRPTQSGWRTFWKQGRSREEEENECNRVSMAVVDVEDGDALSEDNQNGTRGTDNKKNARERCTAQSRQSADTERERTQQYNGHSNTRTHPQEQTACEM